MNKRTNLFSAATVMAVAILAVGCSKPPEVAATAPVPIADGVNVSDIDVTEHVTTALKQNDRLKAFDISVVTLKGDVRLTGVLDNQLQIDEALGIARAAGGAHTVHNELTIKK